MNEKFDLVKAECDKPITRCPIGDDINLDLSVLKTQFNSYVQNMNGRLDTINNKITDLGDEIRGALLRIEDRVAKREERNDKREENESIITISWQKNIIKWLGGFLITTLIGLLMMIIRNMLK